MGFSRTFTLGNVAGRQYLHSIFTQRVQVAMASSAKQREEREGVATGPSDERSTTQAYVRLSFRTVAVESAQRKAAGGNPVMAAHGESGS